MTDDVKQRPVFRLVGASKSEEVVKEITGKQNATAIQGNAFEPEDEYQQLYVGGSKAAGLLEPPYKLRMLDRLSQENNALLPCIEAMVTNVDGTGYDFESDQKEAEDAEDDTQIEALKEFFDQPWPGVSFTTIRKELRRDVERTGNAYLEVLQERPGRDRLPAPRRRQDDAADEARRRRAGRADAAPQGRRGEGHGDAARAPLRPARQRHQPGLLQGVRRQTRPEQEDRYMGTAEHAVAGGRPRHRDHPFHGAARRPYALWRAALDQPAAVGAGFPQGRGVQPRVLRQWRRAADADRAAGRHLAGRDPQCRRAEDVARQRRLEEPGPGARGGADRRLAGFGRPGAGDRGALRRRAAERLDVRGL